MTERNNLILDHSLEDHRDQLRESEVEATSSLDMDYVSTDLNQILQTLIRSIQNLDERLQEVEENE